MSLKASSTTSPAAFPHGRDEWSAALHRPGFVLLPLRLFLGITFTFAGLQKLADPHFFDAERPTSIQAQLVLFKQTSPISFLLGPISHHAVAFGVLTAIAEIGVGLGTLLGLWSRAAATIGALLSFSFFLTVSWRTRPYYYGSDIVFTVMWLPFIMVGAEGVLSLDAWRRLRPANRSGDPVVVAEPSGRGPLLDRRTVVATGAVAAGGLALAGLDAAIGRGAAHDAATPAPTPSTGATSGATQSVTRGAAGGSAIATTAAVDAAGGVEFKDPSTGQPAFVVRTGDGSYAAFTAICTHQGCTVAFDKGTTQFRCPCHGGVYDARTGKVLSGPPPSALASIPVTAVGGQISAG